MKAKDIVRSAILFENPPRIPLNLTPEYGQDIAFIGMNPNVDARPRSGRDEWGSVWANLEISDLGEVKDFPLKNWSDFEKLKIPDITDSRRWESLRDQCKAFTDKFILANGISLYERVHFVRGMENAWIDIYENPEKLCKLIDILVEMNLYAIKRYAEAGADGLMWCDDWGLQDRLMISPEKWRKIWKPRYARVYKAAHEANLLTFLHSCGDITSIMDDLIEVGLDVIQMDQQINMGLDELGKNFGGRITFWCPVDIQAIMPNGSPDEIRKYTRKMVATLGRPEGGFIGQWYSDPKGAGHSQESIDAMCSEFRKIAEGK
jgi:uroporphyrinogen decarboxylase